MSPGASVLFVSSIGAYLPFGMLGFYSVSKTALTALTKLLAQVMPHPDLLHLLSQPTHALRAFWATRNWLMKAAFAATA